MSLAAPVECNGCGNGYPSDLIVGVGYFCTHCVQVYLLGRKTAIEECARIADKLITGSTSFNFMKTEVRYSEDISDKIRALLEKKIINPNTPEEWADYAIQEMKLNPRLYQQVPIAEAIRRAQQQARKEVLEECLKLKNEPDVWWRITALLLEKK